MLVTALLALTLTDPSDILLRLAGGGPRVTAYLRGLGVRDMDVATTEREMSRDHMAQYRNDSTPGPLRIKGLLPPGNVVAHKTGTDGTREGKTAATNDIGIVTLPDGRHVAIAVFVKDSTAGLVAREAALARAAKATWDHWTTAR